MTAGRRVLLSAGFLALATLLATGTARGQDRSHRPLDAGGGSITPDQVKAALARLGAGDAPGFDPFQEMVKDYLLKNNPAIDPRVAQDAVKKLTGNPQLMDQLKQLAKQHQQDPGRVGQPPDAKLAEWAAKAKQDGTLPDLKNLKGFDPPAVNNGGDPGRAPGRDPKEVPKTPDSVTPPPPQPKPTTKTDVPPKADPAQPADPGGKNPFKDKISLDQNPFPAPEEPTDPRTKSLQAFSSLWERNIGPLSETPEVQRALFDLVGDNGFDFDMKDDKGNSLWDLLKNGDADGSGFGDLFGGGDSGGGMNWSFGNWEFPKLGGGNWFGSGSSSRSTSSDSGGWFRNRSGSSSSGSGWGSGGGFSGLGGFGGAWLPFVVLLVIVAAVFVWFQLKNLRDREAAAALAGADGLGAWPLDPRSINSREDVVKAFEYLSVLICGASARNWTHGTIAEALADLATTHEDTAMMLARLYELARYAPLDEPLSRLELAEARTLVCSLAGVSH